MAIDKSLANESIEKKKLTKHSWNNMQYKYNFFVKKMNEAEASPLK